MRKYLSALNGIAASAALMMGSASYADMVHYYFPGTEAPLWDLTGTYTLSPTVGDDEPTVISFAAYVFHEAKGSIAGEGTTFIYIDGEETEGTYKIKAKIKSEVDHSEVQADVKASGVGYLEGATRSYSLSAKYNLQLDPLNLAVYGEGSGKASAQGLGSAKLNEALYQSLPFGMDGHWTLMLDVTTNGKKVEGSAMVQLANGREVDYSAKGEISNNGITKLNLKGLGEASSSKLKLTLEGNTLLTVDGKVMGQEVSW